jgi:hypothetical protein
MIDFGWGGQFGVLLFWGEVVLVGDGWYFAAVKA